MDKDQSFFNIPELSHKWKPEIADKENRKELIEMAAEQFANLLWQQYFYKGKTKNYKKENLLHPGHPDLVDL